MSNAKTDGYISSLNALRGLAALSVVFYHTQNLMGWSLTEMFRRGYLSVDMFFVLSGFVLMHVYRKKFPTVTKQGYWQFITNRFARIYPVHFAILLFLIFLEPVFLLLSKLIHLPLADSVFSGQTKLFGIFTHLLLIQAWHVDDLLTWNGPSWSISAEWFTYLIAPFLIGAFAKLKTPLKAFGGLFIAEAALWLLSMLPPGGIDTTHDFGVLRMLFEFCIGLCVYNLYSRFKNTPEADTFQADWFSTGIIALMAICFAFGASDFIMVQLLALLIPACALSSTWLNRVLSSQPLFYLGEISYSLYMIHGVIIYTFMARIKQIIHFEGPLPSFSILTIITLSSLIFAHLSYTYLEIPCRDYLRRKFKEGLFTSEPEPDDTYSTYAPQPAGS